MLYSVQQLKLYCILRFDLEEIFQPENKKVLIEILKQNSDYKQHSWYGIINMLLPLTHPPPPCNPAPPPTPTQR